MEADFESNFSASLFRREFARIVATLTRILGPRHIALAEDVAQDALLKAMQQWPHRGVPENPSAWLIQAAKNGAIDALRRESTLARKAPEIAREFSTAAVGEDMDDELTMIFLCCHPAIPREAQVALALKTVCGFGTGEIARAFLISETTAAQRVVRAKKLIREKRLRFEMDTTAERVDGVLAALYLMFNEGYATSGDSVIRADLMEESIRLAGAIVDNARTSSPKSQALLALFLLQSARSASRTNEQGELFLLQHQDRSMWDRGRIAEGMSFLERSARGDQITRYHLEAGIAAEHAMAPSFDRTDWPEIVKLYTDLYAMNRSPVIALNRAIAIAHSEGAGSGIEELRKIESDPALARYRLLPAAMGALWREAGDCELAAEYFEKALTCDCSVPERRHLERQLAECRAR